MTRFNHARVFITNLSDRSPVFHQVPNWHEGEGCRGGYVRCNAVVWEGTGTVIGSNGGADLPEEILAPCGLLVYRRLILDKRESFTKGIETISPGRMVEQGTLLPRGHAEKFARACKKCFPSTKG